MYYFNIVVPIFTKLRYKKQTLQMQGKKIIIKNCHENFTGKRQSN